MLSSDEDRRERSSSDSEARMVRVKRAMSKEDAEQEALYQVLSDILPDTIDEWETDARLVTQFSDSTAMYDVAVKYHRITHREEVRT